MKTFFHTKNVRIFHIYTNVLFDHVNAIGWSFMYHVRSVLILFFFMVKQIFLPSFRQTPLLLGLFVSSSKQNLHEKKINGSLGKICVNI